MYVCAPMALELSKINLRKFFFNENVNDICSMEMGRRQ